MRFRKAGSTLSNLGAVLCEEGFSLQVALFPVGGFGAVLVFEEDDDETACEFTGKGVDLGQVVGV